MEPLIAQPEAVRHAEFPIREHLRAEAVFLVASLDLVGGVGADRDDLHTACVEFGPKLFPSPQLGDAVGSPVSTEELDEDGVTGEAGRVERLTAFVCSTEIGQCCTHADGVGVYLLAADGNREQKETRAHHR